MCAPPLRRGRVSFDAKKFGRERPRGLRGTSTAGTAPSETPPTQVGVGVVVVVISPWKPHFLPFVFGAGFFGCFFAFLAGQGLPPFGTPPLSAELMAGRAAAMPRQVTNAASLRVLSFTS